MLQNSQISGRIVKRAFDAFVGGLALLVSSQILLIAAIGIKLTSPGPVFYKAQRIGKAGRPFSMFKLRTMNVGSDKQGAITAPSDSRIFGLGRFLRNLKIDELPQFWNVFVGHMSIVGPRPEDPKIVLRNYTEWMMETFSVRPGLTSPGAIYGYCYGDSLIEAGDPEGSYAEKLLPPKLALERAYIDRANFSSDVGYCFLTAWAIIIGQIRGKGVTIPARDVDAARHWAPQGPYASDRT